MKAKKTSATSIVDSYKAIRAELQTALAEISGCRTVAFCSPASGEGKTTTAINIAVAFSQLGKKVLLIDADMRRGSVHKRLKISSMYSLSDLLEGTCDFDNAVVSVSSSLDVISAGRPTAEPEELLQKKSFYTLIEGLKFMYDYIIIDTPPVCMYGDAAITAALCDGAVMVLRSGSSLYKNIDYATAALKDAGATLLGTVLNGVK